MLAIKPEIVQVIYNPETLYFVSPLRRLQVGPAQGSLALRDEPSDLKSVVKPSQGSDRIELYVAIAHLGAESF